MCALNARHLKHLDTTYYHLIFKWEIIMCEDKILFSH
jgi:hypothetical protein